MWLWVACSSANCASVSKHAMHRCPGLTRQGHTARMSCMFQVSAFRASLNKDLRTSRLVDHWKFQVAPRTALRTPLERLALASPHGCASRTPTTPTLAFPSQANNALLGWRHAFGARLFSPWRGHTSCKLWLPRMRAPTRICPAWSAGHPGL